MVTRDIRRNKSFGNLNYEYNTYIHTIYVRLSRVYYIFFSNRVHRRDEKRRCFYTYFLRIFYSGSVRRRVAPRDGRPPRKFDAVKYKYRQYDCCASSFRRGWGGSEKVAPSISARPELNKRPLGFERHGYVRFSTISGRISPFPRSNNTLCISRC